MIENDGSFGLHNPFYTIAVLYASIGAIVGIEQHIGEVPTVYNLSQNYPNPFNPSTKIDFSIPKSEFVTLKVFDISGREVASLVNQRLLTGKYTVTFDNTNGLSSGVYFFRLVAGNYVQTKKMMMIK
jgi:hypothetical protein